MISIGLVSEDGREFYAELSDTYVIDDCNEFVVEIVLPLLDGKASRMSLHELILKLGNWIESLDVPVKLATDSLSWDWPFIQDLFSLPGTWPENLEAKPEILLFGAEEGEIFNNHLETSFQGELRQHHALDDAKANRAAFNEIKHHEGTGYVNQTHDPTLLLS